MQASKNMADPRRRAVDGKKLAALWHLSQKSRQGAAFQLFGIFE